jgi:hypothetical protein
MRRCLLQRIEGTRWVFSKTKKWGAGGDRRDVSTVPLKGDLFLVQETSRLSLSIQRDSCHVTLLILDDIVQCGGCVLRSASRKAERAHSVSRAITFVPRFQKLLFPEMPRVVTR